MMTGQILSAERGSFGLVTRDIDLADVQADQAGALSQLIAACDVVAFRTINRWTTRHLSDC
ncbi:MAG: hypothetical protein PF501_19525 [Salinisphaera sp.]|nr:hypothetical protein [Salinisphaera sp.]